MSFLDDFKMNYLGNLNYVDKAETFKGNIYTLFGSAVELHETIQSSSIFSLLLRTNNQ